jgi:type I restriction enzyme M protein
MITGELKSKIDKIWNTIWTGGVTSPSAAVEQITYLMFMKLLDDTEIKKEGNAAALGVKYKSKIFKDGKFRADEHSNLSVPYKNLRWSVFHNFAPDIMFDTVRTYVFIFIKKVNGEGNETAFSKFMNDAVFLIPTAQVLASCVDELNSIDMSNKDIMGDVYEYCLSKMSSAGKLGQFRTPRHIIDMMVEMVAPTVKDTILDPAMGSSGFLLGCAKYVKKNYSKELLRKDNAEHYNKTMFTGYDTDSSMLRIGAMNMLLHGINDPQIDRMDSLSEDNTARACYSLVLANPPFSGSVFAQNISKDLRAICKTTKTELLFVALFIESLKIGGRCACIVPEGVLFGSSNAHKALRKDLIENNRLQAVISMPSGVFKPYAGVSTAVLVFTKDPAGTDNVWFYDMTADGYSLDDKRTPGGESDIPDIVERFQHLDQEKKRSRKEKSFFVCQKEITDNNYDLSINKYKEIEYIPVKYPPTKEILAKIMELDKQATKELAELKKMLEN